MRSVISNRCQVVYKLVGLTKRSFAAFEAKPVKKLTSDQLRLEAELKKITNINSLIYMVDSKDDSFLQDDHSYLRIVTKFRELESFEPNANAKILVLLDLILRNDLNYSITQIKSLMSLLFSQNIHFEDYWDFIYGLIIKGNHLENPNDQFIDLMKGFTIVPYQNKELWVKFEELIWERLDKLKIEDIETATICLMNKKEGSEALLKELIEQSKENSNESDIIMNYAIGIINNFRNFDIYHKFIKYSVDYLSEKILKLEETKPTLQSIDNIDLIYGLLPGFHRLLFKVKSYKLTSRYDRDDIKNFVVSLEKVLGKYLELEIYKFEERDFDQVSQIVRYLVTENTRFEYIKTQTLLQFFAKNYSKVKDYKKLLSFFTLFKMKEVPKKYIEPFFINDSIYELFIQNCHIMTFEELYELGDLMRVYSLNHLRTWIFIQNNLRIMLNTTKRNVFETEPQSNDVETIQGKVDKLRKLKEMLDTNDFNMTNEIFIQFQFFVENQLEDNLISLSWLNKQI